MSKKTGLAAVLIVVLATLFAIGFSSKCVDGGMAPKGMNKSCECHGLQITLHDERAVDGGRTTICLGAPYTLLNKGQTDG